MYYLLGYRIVKECQTLVLDALSKEDFSKIASWDDNISKATGITGKSDIFQMLDEEVLFRVSNSACGQNLKMHQIYQKQDVTFIEYSNVYFFCYKMYFNLQNLCMRKFWLKKKEPRPIQHF